MIDGFILLTDGTLLNEGWLLIEGLVLSEGLVLRDGTMLIEGLALSDGTTPSEGFILTDGKLLLIEGNVCMCQLCWNRVSKGRYLICGIVIFDQNIWKQISLFFTVPGKRENLKVRIWDIFRFSTEIFRFLKYFAFQLKYFTFQPKYFAFRGK
jgi:hypothetical protein